MLLLGKERAHNSPLFLALPSYWGSRPDFLWVCKFLIISCLYLDLLGCVCVVVVGGSAWRLRHLKGYGEESPRCASGYGWIKGKMERISWRNRKISTSESVRWRLEDVAMLPWWLLQSLSASRAGTQEKGRWGWKWWEQDWAIGSHPRRQALTGLGLELMLWFPFLPPLLSAASCFSPSGEANFLQWQISSDTEREGAPATPSFGAWPWPAIGSSAFTGPTPSWSVPKRRGEERSLLLQSLFGTLRRLCLKQAKALASVTQSVVP